MGENPIQKYKVLVLLKKKKLCWLVITSKRKLTCEIFHPTTNDESCQVMICPVGLAAVFLYSISLKGREQEHRSNKAKICCRASVSTAGDRALTILYTASRLRHSSGR